MDPEKSNNPPADNPAADPLERLEGELQDEFTLGDPVDPAAGDPGAELLDPETVGLLLSMPFDIAAARRGDHWKLSAEERAALIPIATRVANKYTPALLAKWADEAALLTVLVLIFSKRIRTDEEKAALVAAPAPAGAPVPPVRN